MFLGYRILETLIWIQGQYPYQVCLDIYIYKIDGFSGDANSQTNARSLRKFCVLKVHPFNEDDVSYFKMIVNNYESTTNLICWWRTKIRYMHLQLVIGSFLIVFTRPIITFVFKLFVNNLKLTLKIRKYLVV